METSKLMVFVLFVYCFCSSISFSQELPPGCSEQSLIGENGLNLPDSSYTASSYFQAKNDENDVRYQPHNAKLGSHGWAPNTKSDDPNDYLQIDLGFPRVITAVATQGSSTLKEWVETYMLNFTNDLLNWTNHETFRGNSDNGTIERRKLSKPIKARYIRFIPQTYNNYKTMRVNVYVIGQGPPTVIPKPSRRSIRLTWTIQPCYTTNFITGFTVKEGRHMYNVTGNQSTSYDLNYLKPYTQYAISVRANTKQGRGVWSKMERIKTSIAEPEVPPSVIDAKAISSTSIRIHWTKPAKINGPLKGYEIVYKTGGNVKTVNEWGDATSSLLGSLLKYTTYNISIAVMNTEYTGPPSKDVVIRTQEDECPERSLVGRNSLHVSYSARSTYDNRHQPSSAKLHSKHGWAPKDNNNPDDYLQIDLGTEQVIVAVATQGSGVLPEWVRKYKLHFANYTSQFGSSAGIELTGNNDRQSVVRHDLENPMTAQYVRFVPLDYYRHKTMRVNVYVTYQYAHITMVIPSKRSIFLGWTVKPCFPTHPITAYEIKLETKTGTYTVNSTRTVYNVTNLKPYTEYNVSVRAIKQVGHGVWTNTMNTTTHIAEPEVSPDIYIEATTSTTITIKLKLLHPELIHGPFEGYKITYRPDGRDTKTTVVGRITSYTLTSLLRYKRYLITVAVKNKKYVGPPSTQWATTKIDSKIISSFQITLDTTLIG